MWICKRRRKRCNSQPNTTIISRTEDISRRAKFKPWKPFLMDPLQPAPRPKLEINQQIGGHGVATVLMYLSTVKKGGETVFPGGEGVVGVVSLPKGDGWSRCAKAKHRYAVKAQKGDALLFFGIHLNATTDRTGLHGSCPVIEGEKWSATKWIHVKSFYGAFSDDQPSYEDDDNDNCPLWAAKGDCEKNLIFMVGGGNSTEPGHCLKSCKPCEVTET